MGLLLRLLAVTAEPLLYRGIWLRHDGKWLPSESARHPNQTFLHRGRIAEVNYVAQIGLTACSPDDLCRDIVGRNLWFRQWS